MKRFSIAKTSRAKSKLDFKGVRNFVGRRGLRLNFFDHSLPYPGWLINVNARKASRVQVHQILEDLLSSSPSNRAP
jgi:hypothetical protein